LRSDTPTTVAPVAASRAATVEPFGEGSTSRAMPAAPSTVRGDRLTWPGPAADRPTARVAPCARATSAAEPSRHRYGSTAIPRSTATVSVVVKVRTSTTATYAAPGPTASAPSGPQSNRTRWPDWE
jgi:hypothetical protein